MTKPKIIAEHKVSNANNIGLQVTAKGPIASKVKRGRRAYCVRVKGKTPEWKATAEEAKLRAQQIVEEFVGSGDVSEPGTLRAAINLYCKKQMEAAANGSITHQTARSNCAQVRTFIDVKNRKVKKELAHLPADHWKFKEGGRYQKNRNGYIYETKPRVFDLPDGSRVQPDRLKCSEISEELIESFLKWFEKDRGWKVVTLDYAKNTLSGVFKLAIKEKWCTANPCQFQYQHTKYDRTEDEIIADVEKKKFLSPKVFEAILKIAEENEQSVGNIPWCHSLALYFLAYTGLRPNELFPLKWSSLDLVNNIVHVRVAVRRGDGWGNFYVGEPKDTSRKNPLKKNPKIRDVELPPSLVTKLKEWRLRSPKSADNDRVFLSQTLQMHNTDAFLRTKIWYPACEEYGLKKADRPVLYDLRHVFATMIFVQHKGDLGKICELMGHNDINTTIQHYKEFWQNVQETKSIGEERENVWRKLVNE
jgi:integrase